MNPETNKSDKSKMLKVKDVSQFLQKSPSWVYKNWKQLGGVKCAGSLLFPQEQDIYMNILNHSEITSNPNINQKNEQKRKKNNRVRKPVKMDMNRHNLLN